VILHLDTSLLIDAFCRPFRSLPAVHDAVSEGHRLALSTPVAYEWLRGERTEDELQDQEALLPLDRAVTFDSACARVAAGVYRTLRRARGREIDVAIAACAIEHGATLWTLNPNDFRDIPGLALYRR
jgi:predicted nucleic acid-binding protein